MKLLRLTMLLLPLLVAGQTTPTKSNRKSHKIDSHSPLNKKHSLNGMYYELTTATDSTCNIAWGNRNVKRLGRGLVYMAFAERVHLKWYNRYYMIMEYGTGSDCWVDVVLPLNNNEKVGEFHNAVLFDSIQNLVITEEYNSAMAGGGFNRKSDTVFAIHNLKTRKTQFVVEKNKPCGSAFNHYCFDSVIIKAKALYYRWTGPDFLNDYRTSYRRRIRIKV